MRLDTRWEMVRDRLQCVVQPVVAWISRTQTRRERKLRVKEMLPLGDKRFIAVIEVGEQQLLVGGTSQSMALLARVDAAPPVPAAGFSALLEQCHTRVM